MLHRLNSAATLIQRTTTEAPRRHTYYIGLDVHKKTISYCDFLPESHMMPQAIRDRRRTLRYRHLLVRQMVQMKNRVSGLLMETGVPVITSFLKTQTNPDEGAVETAS